ncbi:hypothetical protein ACNQ6O_02360 [Marinobacter sp. SBS5]|uniref:hypothetical protein n=1 Tax=Marinobacter sp. SBS5 TaxID=3401754 RepID=UPI003AB06E8F
MKKEAPSSSTMNLKKCITPRQRRLIAALLKGPLSREAADRVAGASNSPHHIGELRVKFQLNIHTERVERIDRDGHRTRPGIYHLQADSFELAEMLISAACYDDHLGARNG